MNAAFTFPGRSLRRFLKRWSETLFLLCVVGQSVAPRLQAVSVGAEIVQCPACSAHYATTVILSWSNGSLPEGPPAPSGICPHCLYAWRGERPRQLPAEAQARVDRAISIALTQLPAAFRQRLSAALSRGEPQIVEDYLIAVCNAALREEKPPRTLPRFNDPGTTASPDDRRKEGALRALLPAILKARRAGLPGPMPAAFSDQYLSMLFTNADLIRSKYPPAVEYFLLWVSAADEGTLKRNGLATARNMAALADFPPGKWPAVEFSHARLPLMADCLYYLKTSAPLPKLFQRSLTSGRWNELSDIVLAACGARRDRAAAPLMAKRLARKRDPLVADAVAKYYSQAGLPTDVPQLNEYAQRLCRNSSQDANDWLGLVRIDIEDALRIIRLRELLNIRIPAVPGMRTLRRP